MGDINQFIDFTNLKPLASADDITSLCELAVKREYKSVCIAGWHVPFVKKNWPELTVCSVAGFPLGFSAVSTKVAEVAALVASGADEVDVVLNLSNISNRKFTDLDKEVYSILSVAHLVALGNRHEDRKELNVKFIIETGYHTQDTIEDTATLIRDTFYENRHMYEIVKRVFVKTCTGFGPRGASIEDVISIRRGISDDSVGIKASGGVRSLEEVKKFIQYGVTRVGTSTDVLNGEVNE